MIVFYFCTRESRKTLDFTLEFYYPSEARYMVGDQIVLNLDANRELADQLGTKFTSGLKLDEYGADEFDDMPHFFQVELHFTIEGVKLQLYEAERFSRQVGHLNQHVLLKPATETAEAIFLDFAAYRKNQPVVW